MKKENKQYWLIEYAYGIYVMFGTEEQAEKWRCKEANKNCCKATKTLVGKGYSKKYNVTFYEDLAEL